MTPTVQEKDEHAEANRRASLAGRPPSALVKALGKAVHPQAINRLLELWPEAHVEVEHSKPDAKFDGRPARWTRVAIYVTEPTGANMHPRRVVNTAYCHPTDNYRRRYGIDLAFRRCLREVKEVAEGGR